jgi:uncharacterized protein (TIGR02266 family)
MRACASRMVMIEKRVHPRAPIITKVEVKHKGHGFLAVTEDISSGGMRIATANPPAVGDTLELTFALGDTQREIRVKAVVRHVIKNSAMGVQFVDVAPDDLANLRDFLRNASSAAE